MLKEMSHLLGEDLSEDDSSEEGEEDVGPVSGKFKDLNVENQPTSRRSSRLDDNMLVSPEILKELGRGKKGDDNSSSESRDELDGGSGVARGLKGIAALRRRFKKKPDKIIKGYMYTCKRTVGVTDDRQIWGYRDVSRKLLKTFGKMRTLEGARGAAGDHPVHG